MHFPLSSLASAMTVSSLVLSASAGVVDRRYKPAPIELVKRESTASDCPQYCTIDDVLGPLTSYLPITMDATSFCSTYISLGNTTSYVSTVTPGSTVYATTTTIATTTNTVYVYGSTSTATATSTAAILRREAAPEPTPAPNKALALRKILEARQAYDFSTTSAEENYGAGGYGYSASSELSPDQESVLQIIGTRLESACSCLNIPKLTVYDVSTAPCTTRTEDVIGRLTATVNATVIAPGFTVTTTTVVTSSSIIPSGNLSTILVSSSSGLPSSSPSSMISGEITVTYNGTSSSTVSTSPTSSRSRPGASLLPTDFSPPASYGTSPPSSSSSSTLVSGTITVTYNGTNSTGTRRPSATLLPTFATTTGTGGVSTASANVSTIIGTGGETIITPTTSPSASPTPYTNSTSSLVGGTATTVTGIPVPTICPAANGSYLPSTDNCSPYKIECDTNYPTGDDYYSSSAVRVGSFAACQAICDSISDCAGFVFNENAPTGTLNCFELGVITGGPISGSSGYIACIKENVCTTSSVVSSLPSASPIPSGNVSVSVNATSSSRRPVGSLLPTFTSPGATGFYNTTVLPTGTGIFPNSTVKPTGTGVVSGAYTVTYNSSVSATIVPSMNVTSSPSGAPTPYANVTVSPSGAPTPYPNSTVSGSPAPYSNSTGIFPTSPSSSRPMASLLPTNTLPVSNGTSIISGIVVTTYPAPTGSAATTGFPSASGNATSLLPTCAVCSATETVTYTASFYTTVTEFAYYTLSPTPLSKGKPKSKPKAHHKPKEHHHHW